MNLPKFLTLFLSVSLFILLPLAFSTDLQDVEQSPKFLAIGCIVTISSCLSLILAFQNKISIKRDKIFVILALLTLIQFISFVRCINYGDGLFEFLKLFLFWSLFFQFIIIFASNENNKLTFSRTITISAMILVLISLVQLMPDISAFLNKGKPIAINYSVASSLGNKNFFAETLFLMLPFTLLTVLYSHKTWKVVALIFALIILITLAILQTLSTWVALFTGVVLIVILIARFHKKIFSNPQHYKLFYVSSVSAGIAVVLSGFILVQVTGTTQIKNRITTFQNLLKPGNVENYEFYQNSTYERMVLWKNAYHVITENPLSGVGIGNWKVVSPSYGLGNQRYMNTGAIRYIHPHNDFLLIAAESGMLGLLLFLLIIAALFYYFRILLKNAESATKIFYLLILFFGLTGFIIIAMVSTPMNRFFPPILFMMFAALIVSEFSKSNHVAKPISKNILIGILFLMFTGSIIASISGYHRFKSDFLLTKTLREDQKNNWNGMQSHLMKIDKKYFPLDATSTPIAWLQGYAAFYSGDQETAFSFFQEAEKVNPYHVKVLNDLGTCYNLKGDAATAKQYYEKALRLQPWFDDAILNLSIVHYNAGNLDSAYITLLRHTDGVKMESIHVFRTILLAKAKTFTSNDIIISDFNKILKRPITIVELLIGLRKNNGDLRPFLFNK
ncbi:MAG TPA: DUF6056 family protein [Bacteroidia bacterium]|nr:DUF6056 family protein [Bacteroidia bacterium]